jgi:2'-5' RNA ligase
VSLRSAVVIPVPAADTAVGPWLARSRSDGAAPVPAHVTLLAPFAPVADLADAHVEQLGEIVREEGAFNVVFRELRRFPGVLYLAPQPERPFHTLTAALAAAFPQFPPYEGRFEPVPHLTVAQGADDLLDEAEHDVAPRLPIEARVHEVLLLEELAPDWGRLAVRARLPLRQGW